jgi:transposase InsO family protein
MSVFGERMRWVTCFAAPILLADVGDYRFRAFSLDLKRGNECIFGVHGDAVRLSFQFKPDNDRAFGGAFKARVRAMGIRDRPTSFRSPWQNGNAERLIGSVRRECTDHLIAFNAEHLRRLLAKYAICYNEVRTHGSLGKDMPCTRPIERFGDVVAHPILGGLHHRYAQI